MSRTMNRKNRLGILGGTFNPIHIGHLTIAEAVREEYGLDKVLFVPSAHPPHKEGRDVIDARDRYHLVRLAVADNPFFEVLDIEMKRKGQSYSVETLKELRENETEPADYFFIIGADSLPELKTWKDIEKLGRLCTFVVAPRPGWDIERLAREELGLPPWMKESLLAHVVSAPLIGISSTEIRDRIRSAMSIRYLVPRAVEEYIEERGLYRKTNTAV